MRYRSPAVAAALLLAVSFAPLLWTVTASASTPAAAPAVLPGQKPVADHPETISLNGKEYEIPSPWKGNRLKEPKLGSSSFNQIPVNYTFNQTKLYIVKTAYDALVALLQEAESQGFEIKVESAFRSNRYQKRIFIRMLEEGRTFDDIVRYVAPPGYSQHMLGTAVDFFPSNWSFAKKPLYGWLRENAQRFGFEETFHRNNRQHMPWESWHWNYIGGKIESASISRKNDAEGDTVMFAPAAGR